MAARHQSEHPQRGEYNPSPKVRGSILNAVLMLTCVEGPVTKVQRSFALSILERKVASDSNIQVREVTGSNQPEADG